MLKALESPIRQIAENSGVEGSIVVGKISDNKSETYGFDAQKEKYVDMIDKGIVDPAKVVRTALQDAASVAGLLVTTEAMVAELPKRSGAGNAARRRHGRRHGLLAHDRSENAKGAAKAAPFFLRRLPADRPRQPERELREEETNHQREKLHRHERDDAAIDVAGGDLGRRDAAQEEQRPAERRGEERGLQVHADQRGEPDHVDAWRR